jgi:hypothetical protein
MKKTLLISLVLLFFLTVISSAQKNVIKKDPKGKWMFEAPYAPDGFKSGLIVVAYADKKYSATMAFTGNENKYSGDRTRFENDTLRFNIYVENNDVAVTLSFIDETKMTGKAVYTEGEVPLSLIREKMEN